MQTQKKPHSTTDTACINTSSIPHLDDRLFAVAGLVREGLVCADIGCDHGKLSAYLSKSGKCKKVIAVDSSEPPLEKARTLFKKTGCKNVECRLGDGLSVVTCEEVDDIVIAGLSGVTIAKILTAATQFYNNKYRFIFVPASKADYLRKFLCESGFNPLCEEPVQAAGRAYTVMQAAFTGTPHTPTPLFCTVGLTANGSKASFAYMDKVLKHLKKQGNEELMREVTQWYTQKT